MYTCDLKNMNKEMHVKEVLQRTLPLFGTCSKNWKIKLLVFRINEQK